MKFLIDVSWVPGDPKADAGLIAYGVECAAELGWAEDGGPTTPQDAMAAVIMADGFGGLFKRFGFTGRIASAVFGGYTVTAVPPADPAESPGHAQD